MMIGNDTACVVVLNTLAHPQAKQQLQQQQHAAAANAVEPHHAMVPTQVQPFQAAQPQAFQVRNTSLARVN